MIAMMPNIVYFISGYTIDTKIVISLFLVFLVFVVFGSNGVDKCVYFYFEVFKFAFDIS